MTKELIIATAIPLVFYIYLIIGVEKSFYERYSTGELINGNIYKWFNRIAAASSEILLMSMFFGLYFEKKNWFANPFASVTFFASLVLIVTVPHGIVAILICKWFGKKIIHNFSVGDKVIIRFSHVSKQKQATNKYRKEQYGSGPFTVVETFEITPDGFYVSEHSRCPYDRTKIIDPLETGQHVKLLMISSENEQHVKAFIKKIAVIYLLIHI